MKSTAPLVKMVLRRDRLEREFPAGSLWKHYSGKLYRIDGLANVANFNARYRPVVVFRSIVNNNLWTKTPARFRATMKEQPRTDSV